ncbi:MAG: threonylcarbamoyl-AMP synthase [Deltaproteobacteria bacterium]|nr:threonylcarbamoyl-AMP synthase [Deltaproteobacteria bacterium]
MLININPKNPQLRLIRRVAEALKDGATIAYPTDTYYGIGCDLMNRKAAGKIYRLKRRSQKKPFSFICSDLKNISQYAKVSNYAYKTMKRLLPGPYTFVLEGSKAVPKMMLTAQKTAGIRVPDHPICQALVRELGHPIISTTAKLSQGDILNDASAIFDALGAQIDIVIDGGPVGGRPSSVVSLIGDVPEVIRQGIGDVSIFE